VDLSSPKDSSSPSSVEKDHKPLPPYPHGLKKKDQTHVDKMRKIFPQVKFNIPLLDALQQIPSYARLLNDLYTTKRGRLAWPLVLAPLFLTISQ